MLGDKIQKIDLKLGVPTYQVYKKTMNVKASSWANYINVSFTIICQNVA
jgi:hypothetical protein